jgi:hypothetical protein
MTLILCAASAIFGAVSLALVLLAIQGARPPHARGSFEGSMARWGAMMERIGARK